MADIKAGVLLSLKDQFSQGIKGAGAATKDFGSTALGAVDKVNKAFSGLAGTLGAIGVTVGAGAALKTYIALDDRMVRIGTDIGLTAEKTNKLKRSLYAVAQDPSIKMGIDSLLEAAETFSGKNFDAGFITDNLRDIGLVMKATGVTGEEAANFFIESFKRGMDTEEIMKSLDDMSVIGDHLHNQFSLSDFTKSFSGLEATNTLLGKSAMNTTELFTAMNVLASGTKSSARAVSAYNAIVNELADPRKQELLWNMEIEVREGGIGDFRNLADILKEITETAEGTGNFDTLSTIFSGAAMDAIFAYNQFGNLADELKDLGDTSGEIEKKAESNAKSITSNLQNLQTAFMGFADKNLTGPLEEITKFLNKMAENPEKIERTFKVIALGMGGIAAAKGMSALAHMVDSIQSFFGKKLTPPSVTAGGGAGIPVHVTNWGGTAGTGIPHSGSGLLDQFGNPLTGTPKPSAPGLPGSTPSAGDIPLSGAIGLAVATAVTLYTVAQAAHSKLEPMDPAVPGMSNYYNMNWGARRKAWEKYEAEHPEEMTYDQRVRAAGYDQRGVAARCDIPAGSKKEADENPAGKRAGALDMWGESRAVRTAGEGIPKAVADEINAVPHIPQGGGNPVLEGSARLENYVYLYDKRTEVHSLVKNNTTPIEVNTGSAAVVRENAL